MSSFKLNSFFFFYFENSYKAIPTDIDRFRLSILFECLMISGVPSCRKLSSSP